VRSFALRVCDWQNPFASSFAGLHPVGSNMELGAGDLDVLMILVVPCKSEE
jgi:hypothetical protein